ncbi:MAG TPA: multiheme c-type cytochrome [Burkholderiaceae bacterium]|nr:multiheme c-type cytochrome [Burkholderiaceae bacterium]
MLLAGIAWWTARPDPQRTASSETPESTRKVVAEFVGSASCSGCHPGESVAWKTSQHARAMQHASADTVRGNFDDASYMFDGVTSTFSRRDGKYFVRTDGPDGKLAEFEVKYTFGLEPLQQYLVELPGGRLQALAVTWDTRAASDGGQRWFRQYPDEKLDFRDELHWTQRSQNWNFMCADCHSTNVRKGYDAAKDAFATQWSEISVGCESCHGPGSAHLAWAKHGSSSDSTRGLTVALDERRGAAWRIDPASGNAKRTPDRPSGREIEVCGPCHARRAQIAEGWRAGSALMDHYLPSLLSSGLYHADGQQQDEVFIWGSFLQSRMHRAGVTCSDCHDPHTQKLRALGNAVCGQCHLASKYDSPSHHFHRAGTPGARCADCHMPATTYMVVDPRRDHSVRVPRPDLSVKLGTPNACNACHRERTARWSAEQVARWHGPQRRNEPHYGEAIDAGRRGQPGAARGLVAVVMSVATPPIVRASAVELLARYPGAAADEAVRSALRDADPLVRHAALVALQAPTAPQLVSSIAPLLNDPVRAVRVEAARRAAPHAAPLDAASRLAFDRAIAEYEAVQKGNLDRPESWMNLGNLHATRGDASAADAAYREALKRDARFVPAYVNLADLRREQRRDPEAESILREGLRVAPNAAALHEALGLALVRQGKKGAALAEFVAAAKSAPAEARYAYLCALALHDAGRRPEAIRLLADTAKRSGDRDVLLALAMYRSEGGDETGAREALRALAAVNPDDPALAQMRAPR